MSVYIAFYSIITILFVLLVKWCFDISLSNRKCHGVCAKFQRRQMIFLMTIVAVFLVLLIGLRSERQGLDLYNSLGTGYFFYYKKINDDSWIEIFRNYGKKKYANFEIGFVLFCKLMGTLCDNQQILLLGSAILSIVPVVYFIGKSSQNIWLSVVLYLALPAFATVHFSAIRQGIAMGIVIFSWWLVKEKRFFLFVATIAIACSFHSTAIVAFVAYPMYHLRLDRKSALCGGVGILAIIYAMKEPLFWIFARIVHSNPQIYRTNSVNLFLLLMGIYMLGVALVKVEDVETRGYLNIFWLACAAQSFAGVHNLAGRITWYFMPALIVIVPNMLSGMNIREKHLLKPASCVMGMLAIIMGLYYFRNNSMALAYPYVPFWLQK